MDGLQLTFLAFGVVASTIWLLGEFWWEVRHNMKTIDETEPPIPEWMRRTTEGGLAETHIDDPVPFSLRRAKSVANLRPAAVEDSGSVNRPVPMFSRRRATSTPTARRSA